MEFEVLTTVSIHILAFSLYHKLPANVEAVCLLTLWSPLTKGNFLVPDKTWTEMICGGYLTLNEVVLL
jgi:hypothetical protein